MPIKARELVIKNPRASAAVEAAYRTKLIAMVDEMHASVMHWVMASYKREEPEIAQDASPTVELNNAIKKLSRRWQRNFDELSVDLAKYFAKSANKRNRKQLEEALRKGGVSVKFVMSPAMKNVFKATVQANVSLIKSIPKKYLGDVQGMVMRSVQTGRDASTLARQLEKTYGVTKRKAALIARDQNNKATSAFTKARQDELGIVKARWKHSGLSASKHPRPSHVAANGKIYDPKKGMYLEGKWTWPGFEINCKCTSESVIPGFIY